ncbi:chitin deacetylase [Polyrhizophydium stewartii]|uniref:Chitin deacetylase n=1 Tax=Polyrhizophydium stewartii TaxID=2732419 RepID=A0ABR4NFY8_9FUNG
MLFRAASLLAAALASPLALAQNPSTSTTATAPSPASASSTTAASTFSPLPYPALDTLPAAVPGWDAKFNKGIPNIPVNAAQLPTPVWTKYQRQCISPGNWAVTFDDGPSDPTLALLDELKKRNIKVTFFVVGSRVIQNPAILKRAFSEGHQIALHTWSHPALTTGPTSQIIAEMMFSARAIKETIGVTPKYMRPPYGDIDDRVGAILQALGLTVVIWSYDSGDSANATDVAARFANLTVGPKVGQITLEHDLFAPEASQGPAAVDAVVAGGYKVVRIDECLGGAAYDESIWSGFALDGSLGPFVNTANLSQPPPAAAPAPAGAVPSPGLTGAGPGTAKGAGNDAAGTTVSAFLALVSLAVAAAAML